MNKLGVKVCVLFVSVVCGACSASDAATSAPATGAQVEEANTEVPKSPTEVEASPEEAPASHFGRPLTDGLSATSLSSIVSSPLDFDGQTVRTEGTIDRVCQKMGCWMELREGEASLRVPMAGHSFFIPKDAAGKRATVEGTVGVQELTDDAREHLQAEGAQQVAALHLSATSVRLH